MIYFMKDNSVLKTGETQMTTLKGLQKKVRLQKHLRQKLRVSVCLTLMFYLDDKADTIKKIV